MLTSFLVCIFDGLFKNLRDCRVTKKKERNKTKNKKKERKKEKEGRHNKINKEK